MSDSHHHTTQAQLAVYGGAFNPPHLGHMDVIEQCLQQFDKVIVIPNYKHAFDKVMAPFEQRVEWLKLAVEECFNEAQLHRIVISEVEEQLGQGKPAVFSFDLMQELQRRYPQEKLTLITGPDNSTTLIQQKFYKGQQLLDDFAHRIFEERVQVRSTRIRQWAESGEWHKLLGLVPDSVIQALRAQ